MPEEETKKAKRETTYPNRPIDGDPPKSDEPGANPLTRGKWLRLLAPCTKDPRWRLIVDYATPQGAQIALRTIMEKKFLPPSMGRGTWEFHKRTYHPEDGMKSRRSQLFARFVREGEEVERDTSGEEAEA